MNPRETVSCPECGKLTDLEASFCSRCGLGLGSVSKVLTRVQDTVRSAEGGLGAGVGSEVDQRRRLGSSGEFAPGTVLAGRYRIVALLGRGGMGVVYRADDLRLGQTVALKFLKPDLARDAERLEAFHAEVRHARQVSHPNVCGVYDIGEFEEQHFLTMEYVDGEDLASLLVRIGRLPRAKALEIAHQVCGGLAAAHDQGLVHRDLKPANIMIDGHGRAKVTDFGLAMGVDKDGLLGEIAGTTQYMAPERLAGKGASVKSDIYALGLVLYELYTGIPAYRASSLGELRSQRQAGPPQAPSQLVSGIEAPVERAILRCLEPDPAARPDSARHIAAALPGDDPLAAAIAAGQTPSPEMVAAAGEEGVLRPTMAWAVLGSCALLIALCVFLAASQTLLGVARPAKSPEALAERARGIITSVGFDESPADAYYWLRADTDRVMTWGERRGSPRDLDNGSSPGGLVIFTFRQSPRPLVSFNPLRSVSSSNPTMDVPGMVTVELDGDGRLLNLQAVAPTNEDPSTEAMEPDWHVLFTAAGLLISDFESVEPRHFPRAASDARRTWREVAESPTATGQEIHAASLRGHPVLFEASSSVEVATESVARALSMRRKVTGVLWVGGLLMVMMGSLYFARRNVRLGRSDTRGAFRIALWYGFVSLAAEVLLAHYAFSSPMSFYAWFRTNAASAIYSAVLMWLAYLAMEPYARRYWPRLLIGSSRVLTGRLRDPLVGTHLLIGTAVGSACAGGWFAIAVVLSWSNGMIAAFHSTNLDALRGPRQYLGLVLDYARWNLTGVILIVATLALVRSVTGRRWAGIAGAILWLLLVFIRGSAAWIPPLEMYLQAGLLSVVYFIVLVRFGALATFVMAFVSYLLLFMPLHLDPSTWYSGASLMTVLMVVGMAVFGFVTSLGGRPAFSDVGLAE